MFQVLTTRDLRANPKVHGLWNTARTPRRFLDQLFEIKTADLIARSEFTSMQSFSQLSVLEQGSILGTYNRSYTRLLERSPNSLIVCL